jgi:hypothetical protein
MSDITTKSEPSSFFHLYSQGLLPAEAIDHWVGRWHDSPEQSEKGQELSAYLGLSLPEYQVWVSDSEALPTILDARRTGRRLDELVEERLAALNRSEDQADPTVIRGLRLWLDMQSRARSTVT